MKNSISNEFHFFSLLKFAAPTIVMMIITALYTIVDSIFVSRFVGTNALSAINIVFPVISIIMGIAIMMSSGGSAIIARKLGSGDESEARKNLALIYVVSVIAGILIMIIGIIFIKPIIFKLGSTELLYPYCREYLFTLLLFSPFLIIQVLGQTFFVTAGRPVLGLSLSIASGLANAFLDYVFIVPMNMGIKGAALATGIGYCIPSVAGIWFFLSRKSNLHFEKPVIDFKMLWETCFNGSSEMVTNLATAVTTFLFNILTIKYLGEDGVAAITILLYLEFLLNALFIGFSMGVAPVISYNYGSENISQLKRIFKICISFIATGAVLIFSIAVICSGEIITIFTPKDTAVFKIATAGFSLFCINFLFAGVNIYASALFTALSNGKISAFISFMRTFVFITAGLLILPNVFGVSGLWIAMPVSEFLTMIMSVICIARYRKEYKYL